MKKFCAILSSVLVVIFASFIFASCSIKTQNSERYYDDVIAYVGDETITREELLTAYNNYSFYLNYGHEASDLFDMIYDMLINQKVVVNEAKKTISLTSQEKNEVWENVRKYIEDVLDSYEKEVREMLNATVEEEESSSEEETEKYLFEAYSRSKLADARENDNGEEIIPGFTAPKKEDNFYRFLAYNKYRANLQKTAKLNGKNISEDEAFNNEIDRLYKLYEDSKISSIYKNELKGTFKITNDDIVEKYKVLLNSQIQTFSDGESYSDLVKSSNPSEFIYYYEDTENYLFRIQQILIPFSDEQSEQITVYKADHKDYQDYLDALAEEIEFTYKDSEGKEQKKTYSAVNAEINALLDAYNNPSNEVSYHNEKLLIEKFWELKYYYSTDKLTTSSSTTTVKDTDSLWNLYGYTYTTDKDKLDSSYSTSGLMKLFNDTVYSVLDYYKTNNSYTISSCVTDYGVHYILFTGYAPNGKIAEENYESLSSTYISPVTNETVADYIYEIILSSDKQSTFVNDKIAELASKYTNEGKIKKIVSEYKDFVK